MAGHNKWSSIKHKKAKTDAQKGKAFSKVVREIMMAVKIGGNDPSANSRLRLALQKAKEVNMPSDNVKRAIQKGEGAGEGDQFEEVTFEAYGPNGVALLIETLTDNRNRTVPNLRHALSRAGGSLATQGAVNYLFDKRGVLLFSPDVSQDAVMDVALSVDVEDIDTKDDGSVEVLTEPGQYIATIDAFEAAEIAYDYAALSMIPKTSVALSETDYEKIDQLIEALEEDDDVQDVHSNHIMAE